jgi:hypothetical protein
MRGRDANGERRLDAVLEQLDWHALARWAVESISESLELGMAGRKPDRASEEATARRRLTKLSPQDHARFRDVFDRASDARSRGIALSLVAVQAGHAVRTANNGVALGQVAEVLVQATDAVVDLVTRLLKVIAPEEASPVNEIVEMVTAARAVLTLLSDGMRDDLLAYKAVAEPVREALEAADRVRDELRGADPLPATIRAWLTSGLACLDHAGPLASTSPESSGSVETDATPTGSLEGDDTKSP